MPQDGIHIYMSLIDKVSSPLDGIGKKTKAFSKDMEETLGRLLCRKFENGPGDFCAC